LKKRLKLCLKTLNKKLHKYVIKKFFQSFILRIRKNR
jgi:hypothetical protein